MTGALHAALLGLALCYAGMAGLCFAMDRHGGQLLRRRTVPRPQRRLLRLAGAVLLAGAAWPCVTVYGISVGTVVWLGMLSAGALLVTVLLSAAPRLAAGSALAALLAAGWGWRWG